ncbi:MAG: carbohydrate ABC transporter permease [Actinobacteria bacterium]|nr:carbohydrate ABC transporter permease [Actinomycetota bacterium]
MSATTMTGRPASTSSRLVEFLQRGAVSTVLIAIGIFWLVPTLGLFVASFRTEAANADTGWWTIFTAPAQLTADAYRSILDNPAIIDSFLNTAYITVPTTVLVVILAALAAYAFTFVEFKLRDPLFLVVVGLLVVPLQIALIPIAQLYSNVGLFGTITGVVLFHVGFGLPFAIFLLRNFFSGIPRELLEAARLDGATEIRLFFRVVLPLGLPAIAALTIFQFLWTWNDLLVALVFAGSDAAPLTVFIQQQTRQFGSNINIIAPAAFLSMTVPLIVFFAFQRYFVQGLLAGSQK